MDNRVQSQRPQQRPAQRTVQAQQQAQRPQQPQRRPGNKQLNRPQQTQRTTTKPNKSQQVPHQPKQVTYTHCEITQLPNELFWRGAYVKELARIRLLSPVERRANGYGKPDVEVKSLLGGNYTCYRRDIDACFLDTNGKPIKSRNLYSNKIYMVQRELPPVRVGILPPTKVRKGKRIQYTLNGRPLKTGMYIVFQMDENENVLWDKMKVLSPSYFKRVAQLSDTAETVKKRGLRYKAKAGMTVKQKYLNADFRLVARIEDINTYRTVGFVLSFAHDGKMIENDYYTNQVEQLAKENRIRNMTPNFQLTYGRLDDLPTKFIALQNVKGKRK